MATDRPLKVSYCTTCKGRLHHLKETLPANLAAEKNNPNVEFVILDYDSPDGLGEWIKETYPEELASGRIRYARLDDAPHFKMAHAKNMAHRLATGDILCNLDADNNVAPNFSRWLTRKFEENPHRLITALPVSLGDHFKQRLNRRLKSLDYPTGIQGRIALWKDDYYALNGYNEEYNAYGGDDSDMTRRAKAADIEIVNLPSSHYGRVLLHSNEERLEHFSDEHRDLSEKFMNRNIAERWGKGLINTLVTHDPSVNQDGQVGCGIVRINFAGEKMEIPPIRDGKNPGLMPIITHDAAPILNSKWQEEMRARAGQLQLNPPPTAQR